VQTKGFSAKKTFSNGDADNEADPYSGNHLRFVFGHTVNEYVGFNLAALNSSETSDYDQYSPLTDKLDRDTQSVKVGLVLNFAGISNEISITEGDLTRKYTGSTYDSDRQDIEYKGQTSIGGTDLIFGAASSKEAMVSTWGDKGSDTEKAIFVDVLRKISSSLDVSATMRQTESDDFSSNTSYRLAGIYNLENGIRLRAMGSTGFRAPSLYERYSGNAVNLKPEESQTQELGLEKVYEDGSSARVTVFNTKIENLIEYDTSLVTLSTPWGDYGQSNSVLKSQGLEVEGVWKMSDNIFLKGSYTYTDAKQGTTPAVRVPKYDYSGSVSVDVSPEITSSLSINYIVDYKDTTGDMPDYTVVNASSKYAFNEKLEGYLRVQNLMDADYETVKDFNTGGRQIFAGIRASF
jgi:vitamin B12 transporter